MEISGDFTLDPELWGPSFWKCLHFGGSTLQEEPTEADQEIAKLFVETHGAMLPCPKCRSHFLKYIEEHPPDVSTGSSFRQWIVDFHNAVNDRTDLHPEKWTLEKADKMYRQNHETVEKPKPKSKPKNLSATATAKIQQKIARQQQLTMGRVNASMDRRALRSIRVIRRTKSLNTKTILPPASKKKKKGCGCNKKR